MTCPGNLNHESSYPYTLSFLLWEILRLFFNFSPPNICYCVPMVFTNACHTFPTRPNRILDDSVAMAQNQERFKMRRTRSYRQARWDPHFLAAGWKWNYETTAKSQPGWCWSTKHITFPRKRGAALPAWASWNTLERYIVIAALKVVEFTSRQSGAPSVAA